jgi:hypothetical protein
VASLESELSISGSYHERLEISAEISKSVFGKVQTSLASRLSIRRIMATSMKVSLLCTFRS